MKKNRLAEIILLTLYGVLMAISKYLTELLPNIHLIAMFIITFTVVFRVKALISIYIFVFIIGFLNGFPMWWYPYLYIWTVLWAVVMLLPKDMSNPIIATAVYAVAAGLHGFAYGTLYAPFQALIFGLDFKGMLSWILAGLPFDSVHGIGNIFTALLCVPLISALKRAVKFTDKV